MKIVADPNLSSVDGVIGLCGEDVQEIRYDPNVGPDVLREVIFHESLHSLWGTTTLDKLHSDTQEEKIVHTLATALLSFFKDNKGFYEWLMEEEE